MPTGPDQNGLKDEKRTRTLPPQNLGVVTPWGMVRKDQIAGISGDYEYGNIVMLYGIAEKTIITVLKEIYPTMWGRIVSYVILRSIQSLPMKSVRYLY